MTTWLRMEIPEKYIGEERVEGNDFIKTYKTEILLPPTSEYAGYCFLHPSKLISYNYPLIAIVYNENFTFELIKKDREPGKRYKRHLLTISELMSIYSPEISKVKTRLERKEQKRLNQIGDVVVLECRSHNKYYFEFAFQCNKKLYTGKGTEFRFRDEIYQSKTIRPTVVRKHFEAAYPALTLLCEDYRVLQDVRFAINSGVSSRSSDKAISIYNSFYGLSDHWEEEFYEKSCEILDNKQKRTQGE